MNRPVSSRVRDVRVRIRVPAEHAARAGALRRSIEGRLLRQVLDAFEAAVAERLGRDAIVRIRRLPIRWRLDAGELEDLGVHRRLGEELAEAVLAEAGVSGATIPARPRPGASFAAFADEAHALAVAIVDLVEGLPAAFHHPAQTLADLHQLVAVAGRERAAAVLTRVEALGVASHTVARIRRELAAAMGGSDRTAAVARLPVADPGVVEVVRDRASLEPGAAPPRPAPPAAAGDPERSSSVDASAGPDREPGDGVARPDGETAKARPVIDPPIDGTPAAAGAAVASDAPAWVDRLPTAIGGAAGLLRVLLELELPEHLWCAGVDEGGAIARALARIVPLERRGDPLVGVIAGRFDGTPPPPLDVPAWALAEVADRSRDGLGRWLAKRGDVRDPTALADALGAIEEALGDRGSIEASIAAIAIVATCASLGVEPDIAPVRAVAVCHGEIVIGDEGIDIEIPLAAVDVDVRRAGLDRDPGWIPWLARKLRIIYVPGDGDVL